MLNRIDGAYDEVKWWGVVKFDGVALSPVPSQRVWNHSPDGFAWGYSGSGPAQLALAILLAAGLDEQVAVDLHQDFKREHIAAIERASFVLEVDVEAWALVKLKTFGAPVRPISSTGGRGE